LKSALPGSVNFDMPSFEELGINLEGLLSKYNNSSTLATNGVNGVYNAAGLDADNANNRAAQEVEYQSAKLKSSAYKKLREKVLEIADIKLEYFCCFIT
jgi:hypothetical protein